MFFVHWNKKYSPFRISSLTYNIHRHNPLSVQMRIRLKNTSKRSLLKLLAPSTNDFCSISTSSTTSNTIIRTYATIWENNLRESPISSKATLTRLGLGW